MRYLFLLVFLVGCSSTTEPIISEPYEPFEKIDSVLLGYINSSPPEHIVNEDGTWNLVVQCNKSILKTCYENIGRPVLQISPNAYVIPIEFSQIPELTDYVEYVSHPFFIPDKVYYRNGKELHPNAKCGNSVFESMEDCNPTVCVEDVCSDDCGPFYCPEDLEQNPALLDTYEKALNFSKIWFDDHQRIIGDCIPCNPQSATYTDNGWEVYTSCRYGINIQLNGSVTLLPCAEMPECRSDGTMGIGKLIYNNCTSDDECPVEEGWDKGNCSGSACNYYKYKKEAGCCGNACLVHEKEPKKLGERCGTYTRNDIQEEQCATCGDGIYEYWEGCIASACDVGETGANICTEDCGALYCHKDYLSNNEEKIDRYNEAEKYAKRWINHFDGNCSLNFIGVRYDNDWIAQVSDDCYLGFDADGDIIDFNCQNRVYCNYINDPNLLVITELTESEVFDTDSIIFTTIKHHFINNTLEFEPTLEVYNKPIWGLTKNHIIASNYFGGNYSMRFLNQENETYLEFPFHLSKQPLMYLGYETVVFNETWTMFDLPYSDFFSRLDILHHNRTLISFTIDDVEMK